jgi:amino acid adenylation domain-containing protein
MTTSELLSQLRFRQVEFWLEGENLRLRAPAGALDAGLRSELASRKAEIVAFLRETKVSLLAVAPPIRPVVRDGPLPLSFAQERLWFLDQLEPGSAAYNLPVAVRIAGRLDAGALAAALSEILRRHEVLRTRFAAGERSPVQLIDAPAPLTLPLVDLAGLAALPPGRAATEQPAARVHREVRRLAGEAATRPFALACGPLLRVRLLRLSAVEHVLLLTLHHIVADGWSAGILVRELGALYESCRAGRPSPLPELTVQYADYAVWQRRWLRQEVLEREIGYWKERLRDPPPVLDLPSDRPRSAVRSSRGGVVSFAFAKELSAQINSLSGRLGATPFMTLLAGLAALLSRLTGQHDVVVGSPVANRNRVEIEGLIGFFVNTLVLRLNLAADPGFGGLLGQARTVALEAYAHQDLPFERLVEELEPERSLAATPLFQVAIAFQNTPSSALILPGLELEVMPLETGTAKFDLTLSVEAWEELHGALEFSRDLFEAPTAGRIMEHLEQLLRSAVTEPERTLSSLPLLSAAERHQVAVEWNDTRYAYSAPPLLHQVFERQAKLTPAAEAVRYEGESLSYAEVDRLADRVARGLRRLGVAPEVPVAIFLARSPRAVVCLLGTLKAGGAYMPLAPEDPRERLQYMLAQSRAPVVVTESALVGRLPKVAARVLLLDGDQGWLDEACADRPAGGASDDNLAYIIYTSGSTGEPKGAMLSHRGVRNRLLWGLDEQLDAVSNRVLYKTALTFDVSVWEIFAPLLLGACLVVSRPGGERDASYLVSLIRREAVTHADFVPSMLRIFLLEPAVEECRSLRRITSAGEALSPELQRLCESRLPAAISNIYGPTEASLSVTCWHCERGSKRRTVPIGRPMTNSTIYLVDRSLDLVGIGIAGEVYIGGTHLGRGYLNRPDLTAASFVPDPWGGEPGARLYRTGDLARYLPDGALDFLGRTDYQVKVRGMRVELGEIEAVLARHPGVREAVVAAREDVPGDLRLAAYVVPSQEHGEWAAAEAELRRFLRQQLPEHMVPSLYVRLAAMPLTASGKVDRRALPTPEWRAPAHGVEAPRTPEEEALVEIWTEVLRRERVGIGENFFDLGGHSLLATQVVSRVREVLGVTLPVRSMFESPTIAGLAEVIALLRWAGRPAPAADASAPGDDVEDMEL